HHSLLCIPPLLSAPLALHSFPTRRSSDLTLFTATKNYTYDTALASTNSPFGDKGFVVVRKGGDASILRKNNATAPSGQEAAFQSSVGKRPGDADGLRALPQAITVRTSRPSF